MKRRRRRGPSKHQRAFLAAFRLTASITKAADASKCERGVHYLWLREDPEYPELFALAREEAAQLLEDEAVRRAHEGVLNPVFYKGVPVGALREYSDALMMFLLKGLKPEKFRDRISAELAGPGGGPIPLDQQRLRALNDEQLAQLTEFARLLTVAEDA